MSDKSDGMQDQKVGALGYVFLVLAILFFSGIFKNALGPVRALDFTVIAGKFGSIGKLGAFRGSGGIGVKDGFLFGLGLIPVVMLALGTVSVVEHYNGLRAAQKLLTPLLRPLLGIPGLTGLAAIASFQSTDAGAGMTKSLREENLITEKEKTIFCAFQFSAGAIITNYFSSGAALFDQIQVAIVIPLVVMLVLKFFGANLMRMYIGRIDRKQPSAAGGE